MTDFCNNCDQEVQTKSYTTFNILQLIFSPILFPIVFGFALTRLFNIDFVIGATIGFGFGLVISIKILYEIITQKKKICPICRSNIVTQDEN